MEKAQKASTVWEKNHINSYISTLKIEPWRTVSVIKLICHWPQDFHHSHSHIHIRQLLCRCLTSQPSGLFTIRVHVPISCLSLALFLVGLQYCQLSLTFTVLPNDLGSTRKRAPQVANLFTVLHRVSSCLWQDFSLENKWQCYLGFHAKQRFSLRESRLVLSPQLLPALHQAELESIHLLGKPDVVSSQTHPVAYVASIPCFELQYPWLWRCIEKRVCASGWLCRGLMSFNEKRPRNKFWIIQLLKYRSNSVQVCKRRKKSQVFEQQEQFFWGENLGD